MAQGTLGQQASALQQQQQQGRVTRSMRKRQADEQRVAEWNFAEWQREAERLRSEVFVDKANDPFTFEDYTQEYGKLDPNIQQFFQSPQAITEERNAKIQVEKTTFQTKIQSIQERLDREIQKKQEYIEWARRQNSNWWDKRREDYDERLDEYDADIDEYQDTIRYAQGQADKIDQGATANDILNYGEDKASYERDRREARDKARHEFNKAVATGSLDTDLKKVLGLNDWQLASQKAGGGITFDKFNAGVEKYNSNVSYLKGLQEWGSKIGFANLPDFAKEKLNPDAMAWQKANPTEKLVFDKFGNVSGIESGKLQQSMSLDNYNKLASKTPDQYYSEWQSTQSNKPIYLDFTTANVTMPFETRGTINTQASATKFYPMNTGSKIQGAEATANAGFFGTAWNKVKDAYTFVKEKTPPLTIGFGVGSIGGQSSLLGIGGWGIGKYQTPDPIKLSDITIPASDWLGGKSEDIYGKMIEQTPNKLTIDTQFQNEYQTRFEGEYMKKLIYGEIDFATAEKQFGESDTAKLISTKYGSAITEDTKKMPLLTQWKYGTQLAGLGLGKTVVDFIPTTTGDLAVKGVGIGVGFSALKYIPASVNLVATAGFFGYGTYKAFSPSSTPVEKGSGLLTSVVTGASLGYAGYRYLGSPVVKTVKIPKPKADLYTNAIGKDLKIVTDAKSFNKVLYGEQKLSQVAQAGRRTIVTTKWRSLMNKYLGTDLKNIYNGIPANQPAIYGSDAFRGGRYKITASGYEKATRKLLDYGWSKSQASTTLRYYAPKVTEQWLKSGSVNIKGDISASGKFIYETRKPILNLGEGIKTRGGKTVKTTYNVERKIVEMNDQQLMLEMKTKVSTWINKKGISVKAKDFGFSTSIAKAKVSDLKQGVEFLRKDASGVNVFRDPAMYKDVFALSKETFSLTVTPKRTKTIIEIMNNQRRYGMGKTTLYDWELDFTTKAGGKNIIIQKGNPSAFGSTDVEKIVKQITGQKDILPTSTSSAKSDVTSILKDNQLSQLSSQLKGDVILDPIKPTKMANLPQVKVEQLVGLEVGLIGASALQLKNNTKQSIALKNQLKENQMLKLNQLNIQQLKQDLKSQQVQKTSPLLRFQTPQLNLELLLPRLNVPTMKIPPYKPFPKFIFGGDEELKKKIKAKKGKKTPDAFALMPDFTARSLGLDPKEFGSVKDALKEMKKIQTGFGIRSGGRIKGYSPIDEKQMMRGIMQ